MIGFLTGRCRHWNSKSQVDQHSSSSPIETGSFGYLHNSWYTSWGWVAGLGGWEHSSSFLQCSMSVVFKFYWDNSSTSFGSRTYELCHLVLSLRVGRFFIDKCNYQPCKNQWVWCWPFKELNLSASCNQGRYLASRLTILGEKHYWEWSRGRCRWFSKRSIENQLTFKLKTG